MDRKKTQYYKGVCSSQIIYGCVLFVYLCVCEIFLADSKNVFKRAKKAYI